MRSLRVIPVLAATLCVLPAYARVQDPRIRLVVDVSDAPRRVLHAHLVLPANPGPVTLLYPKWIPGAHAPVGPIANLSGIKLTADGRSLPWRRDDVDMYAIHCDVPTGASSLEASYDYLCPVQTSSLGREPPATSELVVVNWNLVTLYPAGARSDDLTYLASLKLPSGWKWATSLPVASSSGDSIEFKPASLTTLVDSPVAAGKHFRAVPLGVDLGREHELDVVADSDLALEIPTAVLDGFRRLVPETGAIFGARHYRQYRFLLTLSDRCGHFGWEHHESSDDRMGELTLQDEGQRKAEAILLPHEFFHSWNGKFRRPEGLATPDCAQPMKDELLWVYEGLTDYYGGVLAARTGLLSPSDYRDYLALSAARMGCRSGRAWRPLVDTAIAGQVLSSTGPEWRSERRGVDYYQEMDLVWLEADAIIRQRTHGARSLDDFCRAFCGGESGPPIMRPYSLQDVISLLNRVAAYDWQGFLDSRVYRVNASAPLGGIEASGWKLVYTDTPNEIAKSAEEVFHSFALDATLGMALGDDGYIDDVIPGAAASKAGMSPGQRIVGVGGRKYSLERLRAAVKASKTAPESIALLVEDGEYLRTFALDYHGGERYPHLERAPLKPDLLSEIVNPGAK